MGTAGGAWALLVLARLLAAQLGRSRPAARRCQAVPVAVGAALRIRHPDSFPARAPSHGGARPSLRRPAAGHSSQRAGRGLAEGGCGGFAVRLGPGAAGRVGALAPVRPWKG